MGVLKLGTVALDGTKIHANASRRSALSHEHASKNPAMVRDNRHDSVHLFGAICSARGTGAAIIMPVVSTGAMNEHLKEVSTQVGFGAHAVVCDGAGWHQPGCRLRVPAHHPAALPPQPAGMGSYSAIVAACTRVFARTATVRANQTRPLITDRRLPIRGG
jgi:hypothetical protein